MVILDIINKYWNWKKINAIEIIDINDFGNILFTNHDNSIWRICPEELECTMIAINKIEFEKLKKTEDFIEDWKFENLLNICKEELGNLNFDQKYGLIKPAPLGGDYVVSNIIKINFKELISFSADLSFQIRNLNDRQKIKLIIK